ncbi:MAG: VOC family protein [Pseudomonadota bacterium]
MPLSKVEDIVFVRFELESLEPQKEYLKHFGMGIVEESDDSIYFKGAGRSPFIYMARKGKKNRFVSTAYRVAEFAELERLAKAFDVQIENSEEPGGGRKITFSDPDGLGIEVFHGLEMVEPEPISPPRLNEGAEKRRTNALQRFGDGAGEWRLEGEEWRYKLSSNVLRLGHTAVNVSDAPRSIAWYRETLGFISSDDFYMPDGACFGSFMRCDQGDRPVDHHTINLTGVMPEKLHFAGTFGHAGYELASSVDDLMAGHFHLKTQEKYTHEWGIGRHLLGSQMYDYWRDPQGFTLEHWTDGDLLDASVPTNKVPVRDVIMAQYGPLVPTTYNLTMPNKEIQDYRDSNPGFADVARELEGLGS